jgi:hypothetical protein
MRLKDIEPRDYDWMIAPPSPSATSLRIARHQREIEQDEENALEIPSELMSVHAKREIGYSSKQELELLDLEAERAILRRRELEQRNAQKREQDARDAEMLRQLLASKS